MKKLYIVGYGLSFPGQITISGYKALQSADCIFGLPLPNWLPENGSKSFDLTSYYESDNSRDKAYEKMTEAILAEALSQNNSETVFITYGSPFVGTYVTYNLLEKVNPTELEVVVCDAPCSITGVCHLLGYDPFRGLQTWEAFKFLAKRVVPETTIPLLLFQAPYVGQASWSPSANKLSPKVNELQDYLSRYYSEEHLIYSVLLNSNQGEDKKIPLKVADLSKMLVADASTLFIPPIE